MDDNGHNKSIFTMDIIKMTQYLDIMRKCKEKKKPTKGMVKWFSFVNSFLDHICFFMVLGNNLKTRIICIHSISNFNHHIINAFRL